tara:strand:+ start:248 stop:436 length:189 start_codon:yes stop_codon:yes gene_type:complete
MTSLDGYSLNEKMDKEIANINEQIAVLRFRIETEMRDIKEKFAALTEAAQYTAAKKKKGAKA